MSERRPRDEAELQEQADGALTQELGEACGVVAFGALAAQARLPPEGPGTAPRLS